MRLVGEPIAHTRDSRGLVPAVDAERLAHGFCRPDLEQKEKASPLTLGGFKKLPSGAWCGSTRSVTSRGLKPVTPEIPLAFNGLSVTRMGRLCILMSGLVGIARH